MKPKRIMLIAGEPSGDLLAAELVTELKKQSEVDCFGVGGPRMKTAGVDLSFDMTAHAVIGLCEVIKRYFTFRRFLYQLLELAVERRPDVIICVDFGGFNSRLIATFRDYQRHYLSHTGWNPKIVQYVPPQVWASRPGRANKMARDFDLLLSILPFEREWWNERLPGFHVEFVGHPIVGRHAGKRRTAKKPNNPPLVAIMPGSRRGELAKHLPVVVDAARSIASATPAAFRILLPNDEMHELATRAVQGIPNCTIQHGNPESLLVKADVALTKTGTITLECAMHRLPAVAFYKTSPLTYQIGKRLVKVPYLSMPNLLAKQAVYPEFVQDDATPENLANAVIDLLQDEDRHAGVSLQLEELTRNLGKPGAPARAAQEVMRLCTALEHP